MIFSIGSVFSKDPESAFLKVWVQVRVHFIKYAIPKYTHSAKTSLSKFMSWSRPKLLDRNFFVMLVFIIFWTGFLTIHITSYYFKVTKKYEERCVSLHFIRHFLMLVRISKLNWFVQHVFHKQYFHSGSN